MSFHDDVSEPADPQPTTLDDLAGALENVARVLAENEPRHRGIWRRQAVYAHVHHAIAHLSVWVEGRRLEDLEHAAVRALLALQRALEEAAG